MSRSNLKLSVAFEFELAAPENLLEASHEDLCKAVHDALGKMVLQGMPTVTGNQLAKAGIAVVSHHHHLDVVNSAAPPVEREALVAAGPHLTDAELVLLARRVRGKLPPGEAEQVRFLRKHALALANEFRMVACVVRARLISGKDTALAARLNLTNGCVLVAEQDRQSRLQPNQGALQIEVSGTPVALAASCAGHTLSGPVIEVPVAALAAHRDVLIAAWLAA